MARFSGATVVVEMLTGCGVAASVGVMVVVVVVVVVVAEGGWGGGGGGGRRGTHTASDAEIKASCAIYARGACNNRISDALT